MNELVLLEDLGMIYPKETSNKKRRYGLYKCVCGNEFNSQMQDVKSGKTKSCGCLKVTHGLKSHRLYSVWKAMISRCTNQANKGYKNYGGRGITVCDRWLDIQNFIEDMYPTYKEGLTIERIEVDGNYEPNNCEWVTRQVQNRNKRIIQTNNTSGFRGVNYNKKNKKWIARISIDNKRIYLGTFDTAIEAAKTYDKYIVDNNLEYNTNGFYTKE